MQQNGCQDWHLDFVEPVEPPLDRSIREHIAQRLRNRPLNVDRLELVDELGHSLSR